MLILVSGPAFSLGCDITHANGHGWTALMAAARHGRTEMVADLLQRDADVDVNLADNDGLTALIIAAEEGHTEVVTALLQRDADINHANGDGWTALMFAAYHGRTEIVRALLQRGADINIVNNRGTTALMLAAYRGRTEPELFFKVVLISIMQIEMVSSALMVAAARGHAEIVRALLDAGANVNLADNDGRTAFMQAYAMVTQRWSLLFFKEMLISIMQMEMVDGLMDAARRGHTEVVTALLQRDDIEINIVSNRGTTALMLAAYRGHTEIVELFFKGMLIATCEMRRTRRL